LPAPLRAQIARAAASPRVYNLVISNVKGPPVPLFAAGALVREIYPVIPLSDGHALSLGVLTYDGFAHFAWHADPEALPSARRLPGLVSAAVRELERDLGLT
jgi:diacylglycerol O-acyltransferase / wax synthase